MIFLILKTNDSMKKRIYVAPKAETVDMAPANMMASSVRSNLDLEYGGAASVQQVYEADGNVNNGWELW